MTDCVPIPAGEPSPPHDPNPVVNVTAEMRDAGYGGTADKRLGWCFWDESWSVLYGPFADEAMAREQFAEYCRVVLGDRLTTQQVIDKVRAAAKEEGWAIGVHGSQKRDIDLIGVPWDHCARTMLDVYLAILARTGLEVESKPHLCWKPLGRRSFLFLQKGWKRIGVTPEGKDIYDPPAVDLSLVDPRSMSPFEHSMVPNITTRNEYEQHVAQFVRRNMALRKALEGYVKDHLDARDQLPGWEPLLVAATAAMKEDVL